MILGQTIWNDSDPFVLTRDPGVILVREYDRVVYGFPTPADRESFVSRLERTEYQARALKFESTIDRYFIPDNVPETHSYLAQVSIPFNQRNHPPKLRPVK